MIYVIAVNDYYYGGKFITPPITWTTKVTSCYNDFSPYNCTMWYKSQI